MNIEENRVQTFSEWPGNAVVDPARVAKAGFYSLKQGLTVECFSCHLQVSEWNYGDQVMAKHKNLSPNCPFVLNPTTSGNVPLLSSTNVPSSSSTNNLSSEEARLATFENWPIPDIVSPERLARSGFFFLKEGDNTKCAYCRGVVRAWEPGDDPDLEHRKHFPRCSFVQTVINPRRNSLNEPNNLPINIESYQNVNLVVNEDLDALGVQKHKGPKRSNFATVESRLRTFGSWPADLMQTPDVLAQAGFYYEGMGDQVRCFHCDGGLRHWDPQDDPWTEHARWFPSCSFIQLVKGQEFVTACALEHNIDSNLEEVAHKPPVPIRRREVSEREVQEYMTSPSALAALSIGLNVERVKRAIREKLEQTGRAYSQPDALVEAALNLQHDEEDIHADHEQPSRLAHQARQQLAAALTEAVKNSVDIRKTENPAPPIPTNHIPKIDVSVSLEEENRLLKEARLCKICMDCEVGIVFLPCGHLATCVTCAPNLEDCPVCRSSIKATVRTFLS